MSLFPKSTRKKKTRNKLPGLPFPNYLIRDKDVPTICQCVYDGVNFYVDSQADIRTLYHNGSFGRSTLTLRSPLDDFNKNYEQMPYFKKAALNARTISTSNFKVPKNLTGAPISTSEEYVSGIAKSDLIKGEKESVASKTYLCSESTKISDKPELVSDVEDRLELFPEEVVFLSFAVGCLTILTPAGELIPYEALWNLLVDKNPEFPIFYAVYHYFRCKNWVPKLGYSYGGDYVLYELGPEFYHSLYIVHIIGCSRPKPALLEVCAWQRCASHASKFALFCEVEAPPNFDPSSPMSIFKFKIYDVPFHRWSPNVTK